MLSFLKNRNNKITFIFGVPRSGTTWLWSMLESHSNVMPFLKNLKKDNNGLYEISETAIYKKSKRAKSIIQSYANMNKDFRIVEKTPYHTLLYEQILSDFPNSRNILIMRNPISIVNSMVNSKMNAFKNYTIEKSAREIKLYYPKIEGLIKQPNVIYITYETLIDDTEKVLSFIFDYLQLDKSSISEIIHLNSKSSKVSVDGVFRKGEKNSYHEDLTEKQLKEVETLLQKEIEFYKQLSKKYNFSTKDE